MIDLFEETQIHVKFETGPKDGDVSRWSFFFCLESLTMRVYCAQGGSLFDQRSNPDIHDRRRSPMRRLTSSVMAMGIVLSLAWADDKPAVKGPQPSETYEAVKAEFDAASKKYWTENTQRRSTRRPRKRAPSSRSSPPRKTPAPVTRRGSAWEVITPKKIVPPGTNELFDSVRWTLNTSGGPTGNPDSWSRAIKILRKHLSVTRPGSSSA